MIARPDTRGLSRNDFETWLLVFSDGSKWTATAAQHEGYPFQWLREDGKYYALASPENSFLVIAWMK